MNGILALDDEQVEAFRALESYKSALDVGCYKSISGTKSLLKPPTQTINNWMRNAGRPRKRRPCITQSLGDDV